MDRALSRLRAGKIGIVTVNSSLEGIAYTEDFKEAFRKFGWTPVRPKADITPDDAAWIGIPHSDLKYSGLSVIVGTSGADSILSALEAAKIPHRQVLLPENMIRTFYRDGIDASMPVIFIGPKDDPPPDQ
jgi:hypothetical protein